VSYTRRQVWAEARRANRAGEYGTPLAGRLLVCLGFPLVTLVIATNATGYAIAAGFTGCLLALLAAGMVDEYRRARRRLIAGHNPGSEES
jgi:UDP-N-acetylmuramyl pentapeptide phosphotransferase/UDP-N-acetylglucosamine-1-phosphate transferase